MPTLQDARRAVDKTEQQRAPQNRLGKSPLVASRNKVQRQHGEATRRVPARPATALARFMEQLEILVPLDMSHFAAVQRGLDRAVNAGVRLEEVNHPGANGERHHDEEKIPTMIGGKAQHRRDSAALQKGTQSWPLLRVDQWPDHREHRTDHGDFPRPVRNDPRPFVREFFEEVDFVEREGLGQRIEQQVAEGDVDFGHVEQQKHHRCTQQRDAEVVSVETRFHRVVTVRQSEASMKPSICGAAGLAAETKSEEP